MLAQLRVQQQTGNVIWDVSPAAEGEAYGTAVANNWLEPFDWKQIDPDNKLPAISKRDFGIITNAYSSALGFRTDKTSAGKTFKSWADFWNVKDFPGPRSLRNSPLENLEFAIVADGVPPADVYKVLGSKDGVDRAFAKLDEIKPHITHWWTSAQQPVQGLATGELFYATSYHGKIAKLKSDKVPAAILWDGASLNVAPVTIPKGAPNKAGAIAYLKFCSMDPERALKVVRATAGGSFLKEVTDKLTADERADSPTAPENVERQIKFDPDFWAVNRAAIQKRWDQWMQK